jgi:excisionase family DNA binding protein
VLLNHHAPATAGAGVACARWPGQKAGITATGGCADPWPASLVSPPPCDRAARLHRYSAWQHPWQRSASPACESSDAALLATSLATCPPRGSGKSSNAALLATPVATPVLTLGRMIKPTEGAQVPRKLVLSIAEAAEALGVSDDLIYELTARGELPFVRLGRRKVIPAVAIQAVIDGCLDGFGVNERP